eukprot:4563686-Karenia_brevis.AAC.1
MNLGPEHIGQKRNIYNRNDMLPRERLTKAKWPEFIRAVVHLLPDNMIDHLYDRGDTKSLKTAYWNVHEEHQCFKDQQLTK